MVPSASKTISTVEPLAVWPMAFSARLRSARNSISRLPLTRTGSSQLQSAISLSFRSASGAMNSTTSAQTLCRSVSSHGSMTDVSSSARSSSWLTTRLMRSTSLRTASLMLVSGNVSTRVRRIARGVRSSWAASAVNSRCAWKPCSRRSNAWFTACTSIRTSLGKPSVGSRTSVCDGPMRCASLDARMRGLSAPRKIKMSITSSVMRIGSVIQPTRCRKLATMSSMITSRWRRFSATWIVMSLPSISLLTLMPESTASPCVSCWTVALNGFDNTGKISPWSLSEDSTARPSSSAIAYA